MALKTKERLMTIHLKYWDVVVVVVVDDGLAVTVAEKDDVIFH